VVLHHRFKSKARPSRLPNSYKLKAKSCFFDTHAHVNFNAYREDGEEVLKKALDEGVLVVNVGSQYSTSQRAVQYAHKFETGIWAAVGIHPVHLDKKIVHIDSEELASALEIRANGEDYDTEKYLELAKDEKTVAIGEVGLDYHYFDPPRVDERSSSRVEAGEGEGNESLKEKQKEVLIKFIELANIVDKPVMLHCWGAYDDLLEILVQHPVKRKGIVHSFVGSYKTANKFLELGYKIGLNGIATYGESYDRLIREIDLMNIVIETDCPYLTPRPLEKEKRNEPLFVKYVAEKIAAVKNIPLNKVAETTTQNAREVFNL
jgi:TatD DNase family protein